MESAYRVISSSYSWIFIKNDRVCLDLMKENHMGTYRNGHLGSSARLVSRLDRALVDINFKELGLALLDSLGLAFGVK